MKLTKDAEVFSSVGEKVGTLERVVIDPESMEVTFLVVKEGPLFAKYRLVPIQYLNRQVGRRITLNKTAVELDDLPPYDETSYVRVDQKDLPEDYPIETADTVFWYPPIHTAWWTVGGGMFVPPKPKFVQKEDVLPENVVALEQGAKVLSRDGKDLGKVEQVVVEPQELRATHIVVSTGLLSVGYKLVPTPWITDVTEDKITLSIHSDFFDELPEHETAH